MPCTQSQPPSALERLAGPSAVPPQVRGKPLSLHETAY